MAQRAHDGVVDDPDEIDPAARPRSLVALAISGVRARRSPVFETGDASSVESIERCGQSVLDIVAQ